MAKINIPSIKSEIRSIFQTNNTTTSTILDLSDGMTKRVQQIATLNPENIMMQGTLFPAVTVHTARKPIEQATIAKDQVNAKRLGKLVFTVAGIVWNQNFKADIFTDPADNDLENLMENIEEILRHYPDLNSNVKWQFPTDVVYYNAPFDEQTHLRVGLLDIETTIYY